MNLLTNLGLFNGVLDILVRERISNGVSNPNTGSLQHQPVVDHSLNVPIELTTLLQPIKHKHTLKQNCRNQSNRRIHLTKIVGTNQPKQYIKLESKELSKQYKQPINNFQWKLTNVLFTKVEVFIHPKPETFENFLGQIKLLWKFERCRTLQLLSNWLQARLIIFNTVMIKKKTSVNSITVNPFSIKTICMSEPVEAPTVFLQTMPLINVPSSTSTCKQQELNYPIPYSPACLMSNTYYRDIA